MKMFNSSPPGSYEGQTSMLRCLEGRQNSSSNSFHLATSKKFNFHFITSKKFHIHRITSKKFYSHLVTSNLLKTMVEPWFEGNKTIQMPLQTQVFTLFQVEIIASLSPLNLNPSAVPNGQLNIKQSSIRLQRCRLELNMQGKRRKKKSFYHFRVDF